MSEMVKNAAMTDAVSGADAVAVERILSCEPVIRELVTARDALGLSDGELGHAGPPFVPGETPPVVVLNALAGAAMHEGWAGDMEAGRAMVLGGEIRLRSNHALGTVSPMSGVVRPSQRLFRIEDRASGACTFATLAEKGRHVLRFGYYNDAVADGLRHVEGEVAEAIAAALPPGGLKVMPVVARGVELGDDVHQRNIGGMLSFLAALPDLPGTVRRWLADHPQHFLNYAMAAAKLSLDRARDVAGSCIVTAISRNGLSCGIQLAGTGEEWFKAPADLPRGGFFPPFVLADAHADLGDSAIMEAYGLGGCIAHVSPQIAETMQRPWSEARAGGERMRFCFAARNPVIAPALAGTKGVGLGLDARRVALGGEGLRIHTSIAHRDGAAGWIGVGVAHAPLECFTKAVARLGTMRKGAPA
ncbi:Uncharacterised protein [Starkeya nomas]|uniref:DUF1116 domain-containing protein n=1 Tax=Starkeya nomas TaxID=2666134 RepID=A0A5S9NIU6_9HYPH|nr:DUF1116 domain-containing protein [Starkeya nomas]CAA0089981.1 Uncharacterised protein [Starkeya nomas]